MTADDAFSALAGTLRQVLTDLAGAERQPWSDPASKSRSAGMLDRLAEELAQAAAMIRALPGRPGRAAGYTFAATAAFRSAAQSEPDMTTWLTAILTTITQEQPAPAASPPPGSAAWLLGQLATHHPAAISPGGDDQAEPAAEEPSAPQT